jgi:two-component system response regulator NreC
MIRVLLADDHTIVRKGIRLILEAEPDIEIVDEAIDGQEAVLKACQHRPDVVVMDISMPVWNGVEATRRIRSEAPGVQVLVLTVHEDAKYLDVALDAGVAGFLIKRAAPIELVDAVRTVHRGECFLHPSMAKQVVNGYLRGQRIAPDTDGHGVLTERERQVLRLLADGRTAREIAEKLTISVKTVDRHKENMMEKVHARNRIELVRYAVSEGLIDGDEG